MHRVLASLALLVSSTFLVSAWAQPNHPPNPPSAPFFENVTIWAPPASWSSHSGSYGRSVLLNKDGEQGIPTILATAAYSPPNGPYFQIFESTDYGQSWTMISKALFDGNSSLTGGRISQPFLYELSEAYGKYPAGTVMLAGNRIPGDSSSTNIQMYASSDKGYTWEYVSTVIASGPPNTNNGAPCVWEPFILSNASQLAVYFSDQSDPRYGQKLSHRLSTSTSNLRNWSATLDDVTNTNSTLRPGMITIAQIGNGKWMCSYEMGLWSDATAPYATHYRIADSPFAFLSAPEFELRTDTDGVSSAGPYTVWTSAGGPHGTIVVSDSSYDQLFLNTQNGDPGGWQNVTSGHGVGYTRALTVLPGNGGKLVQVLNGGMYAEKFTEITVGDFVVPGLEGGISGL
ncbi:hypothetical protein B0H16DRAFT_1782775 [Mycena metata]|uniref:Glycoside hydrolase family 93 protein n=1 Tax=Mycena metata TaxID=1033252 RepID=A0AAD7MK59_9AGAR|nr:hypothetical protein B0H16DRAFT_1791689 [Mycena metata]KAJ7724776.1 hypothetical protein B0H16DRAFT_1782775 [Mycena metata]